MITKQTYALLALHVYAADPIEKKNKPLLPPNWDPIEEIEGSYGFACTVYRNTSTQEIVISYRGTDGAIDWLTNAGAIVNQEQQAAAVYAKVLKDYGTDAQGNVLNNITFTGHSLGGGLAGTMAVWFNRPGGCKNFCVNGLLAGNCLPSRKKRNDRKQRTHRQPAG